jgi:hypothetical protein
VIIWLTDNLPNVPYREYSARTEVNAFRALHEEYVVVAPILLKGSLWAVLGPIVQASEASHKKSFPPGDARGYAELTGGQVVGIREVGTPQGCTDAHADVILVPDGLSA